MKRFDRLSAFSGKTEIKIYNDVRPRNSFINCEHVPQVSFGIYVSFFLR